MASLKLEHIYKVYPNGTKAVNDISLDIKNGEFIVFVGPSGCGKSTTLRMIAGLEDITAGELYIDNQIVNDVEPKDRDIAMVFQNYALYPHMTVYENMAFGLKLRHIPNDVIQEKVLWAADILGIKDYLDRKPKAMSGGQRQRVALGRAILRDPKVMLLDEPLSNLDAKLRTQMRTEIAKLHQKLKTTFIYVTHDQIEAMTLGDRVVVMKLGRIQQVDTPKNLYEYPANKFVAGFIGTPQMNFFNCTLLRKGETVSVTLNMNKVTFDTSYNDMIKVNPAYLDGKHPIVLGIRCEHVRIVDKGAKNAIPVKVSHFEELGSDCQIYGSINLNDDGIASEKEGNIIIKVSDVGSIKPGDIIYVTLDMDHTYYFDAKTENTIVPRIPQYNSIICSIKKEHLEVLGASLPLPEALKTTDLTNAELQIPNDAIIFNASGIKCVVKTTEVIGDVKLVHLVANNRTFFAKTNLDLADGSAIEVGLDFTRLTLTHDGQEIFKPINEFDSLNGSFYNYQTVIGNDNDPDFVKFRDDKIKAASDYMDAQIALENQNYENGKTQFAAISDADKALDQKKYDDLKADNKSKIKEIKVSTKKALDEEKATFVKAKKEATEKNNQLFAEKKNKEVSEYQAFKQNNKDKETLKRRTDEYHMFKDNFQSDKENTLNLVVNGLTMDYESKVSTLKASARRQITLLKKEISDASLELKSTIDPLGTLEKKHTQNLKRLSGEKDAALRRAGLVFFMRFNGNYYSMLSDIISNKLVQGLGTRVFSKEFRIDVPHDGYQVSSKNNCFKVLVDANYDYGSTYFVRARYQDQNNETKYIFLKSEKPLTVGLEIGLDIDINRSQITETGMNIRLY
jgi:multiple sugar transport system ATP-binding protein